MIEVLFVDDETRILAGLKRLLHPLRDHWNTYFYEDAEGAIQHLKKQHVDVIVSDMMMPGTNGAQLLTYVKEHHPGVVRIILSGHSDNNMIFQALGSTHVYLAKPTDRSAIEKAINRADELKGLVENPKLVELISEMTTLPSLPTLYTELLSILKSKNYSIQKVTAVITRDAGMTAKVLQLVNSAFFGLPRHITDPNLAVNLLGLDVLIALVLTIHVFSELDGDKLQDVSFEQFWDHCFGTATLAKIFSEKQGLTAREVDDAFAAGLLHDAGKIILMNNEAERYAEMRSLMETEGLNNSAAEEKVFGTTHSEVGAYLLSLWGLPNSIVEAVGLHHDTNRKDNNSSLVRLFVMIANILERHLRHNDDAAIEEFLKSDFFLSLDLRFSMFDQLQLIRSKAEGKR